MPNFAGLMANGSRANLMSTIPPLTPAAWSSFSTGTNPGKTGAVGFFRFQPGTYRLEPMNAANLRGTPFWLMAGNFGKRVCVYNVPVTYPAAPVNGIMISGMDAPRFDDRAIYPLEYKDKFVAEFPDFRVSCEIDAPYLVKHSRDPLGEGIRRLQAHLDLEIRVINHLMSLEDWDAFVAVIRSPDSFQHFFWRDAERVIAGEEVSAEVAQRAEAVFACYEVIDQEWEKTWSRWCSDRTVIFMSDHGFGSLRADVCLNRVLANAGLVKFLPRGGRSRIRESFAIKMQSHLPAQTRKKLKNFTNRKKSDDRWRSFVDSLVADIDWERTRLFAIAQHGCLYLNMKGRQPLGTVSGEAEMRSVLAEAEAVLSDLKDPDDGKAVVTGFYRREEIYDGPLLEQMPDMVVNMRDWSYRGISSTSVELSEEPLFRYGQRGWGRFSHTGNHRREGIMVMNGPGIKAVNLNTAQMVDLAPTILRLLGLEIPGEMDGRALEEALTGLDTEPGMDVHASRDSRRTISGSVYSGEDEIEIRRRLENLGYL